MDEGRMKFVACYGGDALYEESGPVYRVVGPFDSYEEAAKKHPQAMVLKLEEDGPASDYDA